MTLYVAIIIIVLLMAFSLAKDKFISPRMAVCVALAGIFAVLTVNFYLQVGKSLDPETATILGVSQVMNLQATIFTAACAVITVLCIIAAVIVASLDNISLEATIHIPKEKTGSPEATDNAQAEDTPAE